LLIVFLLILLIILIAGGLLLLTLVLLILLILILLIAILFLVLFLLFLLLLDELFYYRAIFAGVLHVRLFFQCFIISLDGFWEFSRFGECIAAVVVCISSIKSREILRSIFVITSAVLGTCFPLRVTKVFCGFLSILLLQLFVSLLVFIFP